MLHAVCYASWYANLEIGKLESPTALDATACLSSGGDISHNFAE